MNNKGFTLVEIMIVVAIIASLAAIAIPNLLRARISSQESSAVAALHVIAASQIQWRATHTQYAFLADLDDETPPYISATLAAGTKQGYIFDSSSVTGSEGSQFTATAEPMINTQAHTYYIDEDGVMCRSDATGVTAEAPDLHTEAGCPNGYSELQ